MSGFDRRKSKDTIRMCVYVSLCTCISLCSWIFDFRPLIFDFHLYWFAQIGLAMRVEHHFVHKDYFSLINSVLNALFFRKILYNFLGNLFVKHISCKGNV